MNSSLAVIRRRVLVAGRVQGVGFRAWSLREASRFPEVRGFVRNLPDGRVEAVFIGDADSVLALVARCKDGPAAGEVTELQVFEESPSDGAEPGTFEIRG